MNTIKSSNNFFKKVVISFLILFCSFSFVGFLNSASFLTNNTKNEVEEVNAAANPDIVYKSLKTIGSATDLRDMLANESYRLTCDIDLSDKAWVPITSFTGMLDGCGYKITGLKTNPNIMNTNVGLFATTNGAIIKNVHLVDVNMWANDKYAAGGLISVADNTKVYNCSVTGSVESVNGVAGGLVGIMNSGRVEGSYSYARVKGSTAGGLVGKSGGEIRRCFYYGDNLSGKYIAGYGGIIGEGNAPTIYYTSKKSSDTSDAKYWITDKHGYFMDQGERKVLKGVGNICVETKFQEFDIDSGSYVDMQDNICEIYYSRITGRTKEGSLYFSKSISNRTLTYLSFKRLTWNIGLEQEAVNLFDEKKKESDQNVSGSTYYNIKNYHIGNIKNSSSSYAYESTVNFTVGDGWKIKYNKPATNSTKVSYDFIVDRECDSSYVIEGGFRGCLKPVDLRTIVYSDATRNEVKVLPAKDNTRLYRQFNDGYLPESAGDEIVDGKNNFINAGATQGDVSASFKIPYGESFKVFFASDAEQSDNGDVFYKDKLSGLYVDCYNRNSFNGGLSSTIDKANSQNQYSSFIEGGSYDTRDNRGFIEPYVYKAKITNVSKFDFFFDNTKRIEMFLNQKDEYIHAGNTHPVVKLDNGRKSIYLSFLIGEKFSDNNSMFKDLKISANYAYSSDGSSYTRSTNSSSITSTNVIYPAWRQFFPTAISGGGFTFATNTGAYESSLTLFSDVFWKTNVNSIYVYWQNLNTWVNVLSKITRPDDVSYVDKNSFMDKFVVNTIKYKDITNKEIAKELEYYSYISSDKAFNEDFDIGVNPNPEFGIDKSINGGRITNDMSLRFTIRAAGGYELKTLKVKVPSYKSGYDVISLDDFDDYKNHTFQYCLGFAKDTDVNQITFNVDINRSNDNIYTLLFSSVIGLDQIVFEIKPKTWTENNIIVSENMYNGDSPLSATLWNITKDQMTTEDKKTPSPDFDILDSFFSDKYKKGAGGTTKIYETGTTKFDISFFSYYMVAINNIEEGYEVTGVDIISKPYNIITESYDKKFKPIYTAYSDNAGTPNIIGGKPVEYPKDSGSVEGKLYGKTYYTFIIRNADASITGFDILIKVRRQKANFKIVIDESGVEVNTLPGFKLDYSIIDYKNKMVEGTSTSQETTIPEVRTGAVIKISITYPEWLGLPECNVDDYISRGHGETEGVIKSKDGLTLELKNHSCHGTGDVKDEYVITLKFTIKSATVKITKIVDNNEKETPIILDNINYGTVINVSKTVKDGKDVVRVSFTGTYLTYYSYEDFAYESYMDHVIAELVGDGSPESFPITHQFIFEGLFPEQSKKCELNLRYFTKTAHLGIYQSFVRNAGTTIVKPAAFKNDSKNTSITWHYKEPQSFDAESVFGYDFVGWSYHEAQDQSFTLADKTFNKYTKSESLNVVFLDPNNPSAIQYSPYIYFVAIYRAKMYGSSFDYNYTDDVTEAPVNNTLNGNSGFEFEYGQPYNPTRLYIPNRQGIFELPRINVDKDDMYNFTGWRILSKQKPPELLLKNNTWDSSYTFYITKDVIDAGGGKVSFKIIMEAKIVTLKLMFGKDVFYEGGTVEYGTSNYKITSAEPVNPGYEFVGWEWSGNGKLYLPKNGKNLICDFRKTEISLDAKFKLKEVKVTIDTGINEATFGEGGSKTVTGKVTLEKNSLTSIIFDTEHNLIDSYKPYWNDSVSPYMKFKFLCFTYMDVYNEKKYIIPHNIQTSSDTFYAGKVNYDTFSPQDIDYGFKKGEIVLTACYRLERDNFAKPVVGPADGSWKLVNSVNSLTYDSLQHNVGMTISSFLNNNFDITYSWTVNGVYDNTNSNQISLKDAIKYSVVGHIKVESKLNIILVEKDFTSSSNAVKFEILKKELIVKQNDVNIAKDNPITKVFDNNDSIVILRDHIQIEGICASDNPQVTLTYPGSQVKDYSIIYWSISDAGDKCSGNYFIDDKKLSGKIIEYELQLGLIDPKENFEYQYGDSTIKVNISDKFDIVEDSVKFLTSVGFTFDFKLYTNRNVIGTYKQDDKNNYYVVKYNVLNDAGSSENKNFKLKILDKFLIKDADEGSLLVTVYVKSNDRVNYQNETLPSSAGQIYGKMSNVADQPHIADNDTSVISILKSKDYFKEHNQMVITLTINNNYYSMVEWKVFYGNEQKGNNFAKNTTINFAIEKSSLENTKLRKIDIFVYLTKLREITFDYNIADAKEVEHKITRTNIALGETIVTSIKEYGTKFQIYKDPQKAPNVIPSRVGFVFVGWKIKGNILTDLTVWDFSETEVKAVWEIDTIKLKSYNRTIEFEYNTAPKQEQFDILNKNILGLEYSYSWENDAKTPGVMHENVLRVIDHDNSGIYTLTITAKNKKEGTKKIQVCKVNVDISQKDVFDHEFTIDKDYDATKNLVFYKNVPYTDPVQNMEIIKVTGYYKNKDAEQNIDKTTLVFEAFKANGKDPAKLSNYIIHDEFIKETSKINKKDVVLDIGIHETRYSTKKYSVSLSYKENLIAFDYVVTTKSEIVGFYTNEVEKPEDYGLDIEIKQPEDIDNFNITILGSITINKKLLTNNDVKWKDQNDVVFDGQNHYMRFSNENLEKEVVGYYVYYDKSSKQEISRHTIDNWENKGVVYAGQYLIKIEISKNNINYEIEKGGIFAELLIRKKTIRVSSTNKYTRPYNGFMNVTESNEFIVEDVPKADSIYLPTIIYEFNNPNAGKNKPIRAHLDAEKKVTGSYELSQNTMFGEITKVAIIVNVKATKTYDGLTKFITETKNGEINAVGLVNKERIKGKIEFEVKLCNIPETKPYTDRDDTKLKYTIYLTIGTLDVHTNYVPTVKYELNITKANVQLEVDNLGSYKYTGKEVVIEYKLKRTDVISYETPKVLTINYETVNDETSLNNGRAVQVGAYYYKFSFSNDHDNNNFKFYAEDGINDHTKDTFSIVPRAIVIHFEKQLEYNAGVVTYSSEDWPEDNILDSETPIGFGDKMVFIYKTVVPKENASSGACSIGQYYVTNQTQITVVKQYVQRLTLGKDESDDDYSKNYTIGTNTNSNIHIIPKVVDFSEISFLGDVKVYNSKTQFFTDIKVQDKIENRQFVVIDQVIRDAANGVMELDSPDEIVYVGKYSVTISLPNYIILNNKARLFTIIPYEVDIDVSDKTTISKPYDGNTNVLEKYIIMDKDKTFFIDDVPYIRVKGFYDNKDVGKNKTIKFNLDSSNILILSSYKLITQPKIGEIVPKVIVLTIISGKSVYYNGELFDIDIANFNVKGMVAGEVLTGFVKFTKRDSGRYQLDTYNKFIDPYLEVVIQGSTTSTDNYAITYSKDSQNYFEIKKAIITVSVGDLIKTYNAKIQEATLSYGAYRGAIAKDFKPNEYYVIDGNIKKPINAGVYFVRVSVPEDSNYLLCLDTNTAALAYDVQCNETLLINKRKIAVKVEKKIPRRYTGESCTYDIVSETDVFDPTTTQDNGLVPGHILTGVIFSVGFKGQEYNIPQKEAGALDYRDIKITYNSEDVTNNYTVVSYEATMVIVHFQAEEYNTDKIQNIVYNGKNKIDEKVIIIGIMINDVYYEYTYDSLDNPVFLDLKYEGEPVTKIINAGHYTFIANASYEGIEWPKLTEFDVKTKDITSIEVTDLNKPYDATSKFTKNITTVDICIKEGFVDDLVLKAKYVNKTNPKIEGIEVGEYRLFFTISGKDAYNYNVDKLKLYGEIVQREVTLSVKSTYKPQFTNREQVIPVEQLISKNLVPTQYLAGSLAFNQIDAGIYDFKEDDINVGNIQIYTQAPVDVTHNYCFKFEGKFEIVAKAVTLTVKEIKIIYDAEIRTIDEFIDFTIDIPAIKKLARDNIKIDYDKVVIDVDDYVATVSSKSKNFVYTVAGYSNNQIPFKILQREIVVNIGDVKIYYNPTSDYKTALVNKDIENIVPKHNITGSYYLYKKGLDVKPYHETYKVSTGEILFTKIQIIVNNQDILPRNYKITAYKGTLEILPFIITEDNLKIIKDTLIYTSRDAIEELEIFFMDANNVRQVIKGKEGLSNPLGNFAVIGGVAVNVGSYRIKVHIKNCAPVKDVLTFKITPKPITEMIFTAEKQYDGTSFVYNSISSPNLTSRQIFEKDAKSVVIKGFYYKGGAEVSEIGENYDIEFKIQDAESLPQRNYVINITAKGSILVRDVGLKLKNYEFVYNTTGYYELEYNPDDFDIVTNPLVKGDTFSGKISIVAVDYIGLINNKTINLSELKILDSKNMDNTKNYAITMYGKVSIIKAIVDVDFGEVIEFIYSTKPVVITPKLSLVNSLEEQMPKVTYYYESYLYGDVQPPKDIGKYTLTLSLVSNCYEFVPKANIFEFTIKSYAVIVKKGEIPNNIFFKTYGDSEPKVFVFKYTTPLNEVIDLYLNRLPGENAGRYTMTLNSWNNKNYNVTFGNGAGENLFLIKKAARLDITIDNTKENQDKLAKIYDTLPTDKVDIKTLDISYKSVVNPTEVITGFLIFEQGSDVGSYALVSWDLQNNNYEGFKVICELKYKIGPKDITVYSPNNTKSFDNTLAFLGEIKFKDSNAVDLDTDIFLLKATGEYKTKNVNNNIEVNLQFSGDSISNYNLLNTLKGNIVKREVIVRPDKDQFCIYGNDKFDITYTVDDNESTKYTGDFKNEITGNLYIDKHPGLSKYVVGDYDIRNNLSSSNLNISFIKNIIYKINKKEIFISNSLNFEKVYDGKADVKGTFIISGLVGDDKVSASALFYEKEDLTTPSPIVSDNKVVIFTLSGADSNNYFVENVVGAINNKLITINFKYDTKQLVHNPKLVKDDDTKSVILIYGLKVSESLIATPVPKHEGYNFRGWYFEETCKTEFNLETLINESNWPIELDAKTVYAKWSIKQFNVRLVGATRVNKIYTTDPLQQGGRVSPFNDNYDYYSVIKLSDLKNEQNPHPFIKAFEGYEFIGYADDLLARPKEEYITTGWTVRAGNNIIYAKFKPLTIELSINANGGSFENMLGWHFNQTSTVATIEVEYNQSLKDNATTIPVAHKKGYNPIADTFKDEKGNNFTLETTTPIGKLYLPSKVLYVQWEAMTFNLILNASGGHFENYDTNIWTPVETVDEKVLRISKKVTYDSPVGELLSAERKGWIFDGFNKITTDYIWDKVEDYETNALWLEKEFDIVLNSEHGNLEILVLSSEGHEIRTNKLDTKINTSVTVKVKTTNKIEVTVLPNSGYEFADWTSSLNREDMEKDGLVLRVEGFLEEQEFTTIYSPRKNKITLKVSHANRGTLSSGDQSTTEELNTIDIYAFTETLVDLSAICVEGYIVADWKVKAFENLYELTIKPSDNPQIDNRTLSGFVGDTIITVFFEPRVNIITIVSDEEKGMIEIPDVISNVPTCNYGVKTEETLEFYVTIKHGYDVVTDLTQWAYDTVSANKGKFSIMADGDVYKITFSGFTADGSITIPFKNKTYTITVNIVYNDITYELDELAKEIVLLNQDNSTKMLDAKGTFSGLYKSEVSLTPKYVKKGYSFSVWSSKGDATLPLNETQGFVGLDTGDGTLQFRILDDMTIYMIYLINDYIITYSVSDNIKGYLMFNDHEKEQVSIVTKFGRTTKPVLAVAKQYFAFDKWVMINEEGLEVDYGTPGTREVIIKNVESDMILIAKFKGTPVVATIEVDLLDEPGLASPKDNFADIEIMEVEGVTKVKTSPDLSKPNSKLTWTIDTLTGEQILFKLKQKNGYIYASSNPYLTQSFATFSESKDLAFETSIIYKATSYNITMKAKTNVVTLQLTGDIEGARVYADTNSSSGVEQVNPHFDNKTIDFYVKTGGSFHSFVNIYKGYKLVNNEFFSTPKPTQNTDMKVSTAYINNINSDRVIEVEISAHVYEVTFDYNYEGASLPFVATVKIGGTTFTPDISDSTVTPERPKYDFVGWNMEKNDLTKKIYYFKDAKIYSYEYVNGYPTEKLGFSGVSNAIPSNKDGIDYECTLYGYWVETSYNIDIEYVPTTASEEGLYNYRSIFPNEEGRRPRYNTDKDVIGISYIPDSKVRINAPYAVDGYTYYGWSYEEGITDKAKLNYGDYEQIMGEENIKVYLYYTIDVVVSVEGEGKLTVTDDKVLYNTTIKANAESDYAYIFDRWVLNGTDLEDQSTVLELVITEVTELKAVFLGEEIRIILDQVPGVKTRFTGTDLTEKIFRVGDTVPFELYGLKYGYYNMQWEGEFAGKVIDNQYKIVPDDVIKKYARFKANIGPMAVNIIFQAIDQKGGISGGEFIIDGEPTYHKEVKYKYDETISYGLNMAERYELVSLTINGVRVDKNTVSVALTKDNGFTVYDTNIIKAVFKQSLWIDSYEMFTGFGTKEDPYVISSERQLAAMAYLINNNIAADGRIPYANGYYKLNMKMNLMDKFWQPIGTSEHPFNGTFDFTDNRILPGTLFLDKADYEVTSHDGLFGYTTTSAKFLQTPVDYTVIIITVCAIVGGTIVVAGFIFLFVFLKKKKRRELQTNSTILMTQLYDDVKDKTKHK